MSFLQDARAKLQKRDLVSVSTSAAALSGSIHSYDPKEKERYAARLNKIFAGDPTYTPINPAGDELWARLGNGDFLCKLMNKCEPGCIPESAMKKTKPGATTSFHTADLITMVISTGKAIGLEMVGLGATDFTKTVEEKREHLVLGCVWQLLRRNLAQEIKAILKKQEEEAAKRGKQLSHYSTLMASVLKDPESYLVQWVNDTMKAKGLALANGGKGAGNMAELSLGQGDTLLRLMHALDASTYTTPEAVAAAAADPTARATAALDWVTDHAIVTLSAAEDITSSNPKQIMPFVMGLFTWVSSQPGKESMFVVRSHTHLVLGEGGTKASSTSASVCLGVYKSELEALQFALIANITSLATDKNVAAVGDLLSAYAKITSDPLPSLTAAMTPVTDLLPKGDAPFSPTSVEMWVKGKKVTTVTEGGAGEGEKTTEVISPALSMEQLQEYYGKVSGLLKSGSSTAKGSVVVFEVDVVTRY